MRCVFRLNVDIGGRRKISSACFFVIEVTKEGEMLSDVQRWQRQKWRRRSIFFLFGNDGAGTCRRQNGARFEFQSFLGFTREMRTLNSDEPARKGKGHKILFQNELKAEELSFHFEFPNEDYMTQHT
jgi:hypothetical protein